MRALVVGIDRYRSVAHLDGAVADALDMAGTLRRRGVSDLIVLMDEQATRAALTKALQGLADRAQPSDVVIITFAGHGAQEKTTPSPAEPDGMDEFYMLWGFGTAGQDTAERMLDDEVYSWLGRIGSKGAQVIFLADVCYGGGLAKAIDTRGGRLAVRGLKRVGRPELVSEGTYYIAPSEDRLPPLASIREGDDATRSLPNLTFIAAVDDQHEAPEIQIAGEATPRGAASYVLARALEGQADLEGNRDGTTTRGELIAFVRRHVRVLSGNRQSPVAEPRLAVAAKVPLFSLHGDAPSGEAAAANLEPAKSQASHAIAIIASAPSSTSNASTPVAKPSTERPKLYWDEGTGDVISANGDVVAFGVSRLDREHVVQRADAIHRLMAFASGRSIDMTISPVDRVFANGERFTSTLEGIYGRYLILLNLAGDGTVQYLFPTDNVDPLFQRETLDIPLRAGPPFGTDSLIALALDRRNVALELELKLLDKRRVPLSMFSTISERLAPTDRIAIGTYSTRP